MSDILARKLIKARYDIARQLQWIVDHGNDVVGYCQRYGFPNDPNKLGDGGVAIYESDVARLRELELRAAVFERKLDRR